MSTSTNKEHDDESMGMGTVEIESSAGTGTHPRHRNSTNLSHYHAAPKRQISNLSLPKKKSGIAGASSNLVNSIVGAGIIGIPFALKQSGLLAGVVLLFLVSYFTDKSLRMLVEMATFHPRLKDFGVYTYEDLMMLPFGTAGHHFILASMLVTAYGAMVAYLLIIKDTLPVVLGLEDVPGAGGFLEREGIMIATSLIIMVPLSIQRDMSSLAFTSFISVLADAALVVFVAAFSPVKSTVSDAGGFGTVFKDNLINPGFFIGFGVLTIAMTCQHSAFIVSGSLGNLTRSRWATVTFQSLTIACLLCAVLGISGYLGYLDETQGDILNNFDPDTNVATAARVLLALTMFFTYPMESFVARHVLIKLLFDGDMDGHVVNPNTGETTIAPKTCGCLTRRIKWTVIIYILTLIPALIVDDLGPVLSITGSIGGCCLAYIGPGLAYLGVHGDSFLLWLAGIVDNKNRTKPNSTTTAGDLPVAGDANASMQTAQPSLVPTGPKPWWWWPTLMPIWVSIASSGSNGMHERLTALEQEHGPISSFEEQQQHHPDQQPAVEVIGPCKRDYFISMFFIVFGVVAGVAGILSNVYVQVNNIFFNPK